MERILVAYIDRHDAVAKLLQSDVFLYKDIPVDQVQYTQVYRDAATSCEHYDCTIDVCIGVASKHRVVSIWICPYKQLNTILSNNTDVLFDKIVAYYSAKSSTRNLNRANRYLNEIAAIRSDRNIELVLVCDVENDNTLTRQLIANKLTDWYTVTGPVRWWVSNVLDRAKYNGGDNSSTHFIIVAIHESERERVIDHIVPSGFEQQHDWDSANNCTTHVHTIHGTIDYVIRVCSYTSLVNVLARIESYRSVTVVLHYSSRMAVRDIEVIRTQVNYKHYCTMAYMLSPSIVLYREIVDGDDTTSDDTSDTMRDMFHTFTAPNHDITLNDVVSTTTISSWIRNNLLLNTK